MASYGLLRNLLSMPPFSRLKRSKMFSTDRLCLLRRVPSSLCRMFRKRGHVRLPYKEWRRSQQARHLWQHSATLVRHTQQNSKLVYN